MFMVRWLYDKPEANTQRRLKHSSYISRTDVFLPVFQITGAEDDEQPSHAVPLS